MKTVLKPMLIMIDKRLQFYVEPLVFSSSHPCVSEWASFVIIRLLIGWYTVEQLIILKINN